MIRLSVSKEDNPSGHPAPTLEGKDALWKGCFQAMASDCELLFEGVTQDQAKNLTSIAACEAWRIEHKYSRYRHDNIMFQINHSNGSEISVDQETCALLNFADQCFQLSEGLFDVSSGILRKIWHFDGSDTLPSTQEIEKIIPLVGWSKISWSTTKLKLKPGMEIDLGGIGKEYAVDKVIQRLNEVIKTSSKTAFLVNFGGDLACSGKRLNGQTWQVAIESSEQDKKVPAVVKLSEGAVATSGDSRRFLLKDGVRYSHILNPKTAMPVINAPRAISVAAENCMQAGMLSTLAMLQGEGAEDFLDAQEVQYWIQR